MSDKRMPLPGEVFPSQSFPGGAKNHAMIGASRPMRAMFAALPTLAASSKPLLVSGERGTGKGMIARTLHELSDRADGPFVTVDCTAVREPRVRAALLDSLRLARRGTLVLDGVGDLSPDLQALLLGVLGNRETGIPGEDEGLLDSRIISITDTDLEAAVERGGIRDVLYRRLSLLKIKAPPLRERGRDVQLLADFFFGRFTTPASRRRTVGFTAEARLAMQLWSWPGNVRELVNRVRNAIVRCEKGPLYSSDLGLDREVGIHGQVVVSLDEARNAAELGALLAALTAADGELAAAAAKLGTSRVALFRLMQKHGIDLTTPQLVVDR